MVLIKTAVTNTQKSDRQFDNFVVTSVPLSSHYDNLRRH